MKKTAPLLLLLLMAACAQVAAPPPAPPEALPPLARAAVSEWEVWGRVVLEGWPETRPADTAATPARFTRLLGYWSSVPGNAGVARQLSDLRYTIGQTLSEQGSAAPTAEDDGAAASPQGAPGPEDIALYNRPAWSAAFITAVARRAGIAEVDLPPAPTHARYVDALLARAMTDPQDAPFLPYAPEERAPLPGDLLCSDRAARPLGHWSERLAEAGRFRPMHCDVVIRTGPQRVEVIGGNVEDLVALRRLPADAQGRVLPAPPGKPSFLLLLAARHPG